jgi:hypothetical protein
MFHFFKAITNKNGDALVGYYVKVADSVGNVVPLYADSSGTPIVNVSGLADTAKVDTNGNASFYVNPGEYTLNIYAPDATTLYLPVPDMPMGLNTITLASGSSVATIAGLQGIALPVANQSAILTLAGREGTFVFDASDLSAKVTADTLQGIYVAPSSDTTGASGAWVRKYKGGADPRWFGCTLDGVTDDKAAFTAAITVAKHVIVPDGFTLHTTGEIQLPSNTHIEGKGGTVDFLASTVGTGQRLFSLTDSVSNIRITGLNITCSSDVDFIGLIRMSQLAGTTLDGLDVLNNVVTYSATPSTSADRWFVVGTGPGTRKNIRVNGNRLDGPMQLMATPVAVGTFQDSEICYNRVHNSRSNSISLLSAGDINATYPCALSNVKVTDNVITADAYTSIGIVVGIDSTGANDKNMNIQNLLIARNKIDITGSSNKTADIWIRLANQAVAAGGFNSVSDHIVIADNDLSYAVTIAQNPISLAGLSQITNFAFTGNTFTNNATGIDINLRYLATGATITNNRFPIGTGLRLGELCGTIFSQGNIYSILTNTSNDAEFTWRSLGDTYLGSASGTDRVCTFNANAGKVQVAYFDRCTIDTSTTGASGKRSAIYTLGAGAPTVYVRNLTSSTTWGLSLFEVSTGSVTAYGDTGTLAAANTWTAAQTFQGSVKVTSATAGIGYGTGAGGTVTQATSKATGVTLNKSCGQITMNNAALAAGTIVSFVVTNSAVSAGDLIVLNHIAGGTVGAYTLNAATPSAGQFTMYVRNNTAGSLSEALVIEFAVIKATTS